MRMRHGVWMVGAVLWTLAPSLGCHNAPQELPVVVSAAADAARLQWRDPEGPLRGEVPWVLRTDVMGPDTFLVVETPAGDMCARQVTFRVLAAETTEYTVTLTSDLEGKVAWRVTYGDDKKVKLFTCEPRTTGGDRRECLRGGIPKPLSGELVGGFSAQLVGGAAAADVRAVRFEDAFPCAAARPEAAGGEAPGEPSPGSR